MEKLKDWGTTALGLAIIVFVGLGAFGFFSNNDNGIHPIGENAVYIAGEVCTVNMGLDRTPHQLHADFDVCVKLHTGYRSLDEHKEKGTKATIAEK